MSNVAAIVRLSCSRLVAWSAALAAAPAAHAQVINPDYIVPRQNTYAQADVRRSSADSSVNTPAKRLDGSGVGLTGTRFARLSSQVSSLEEQSIRLGINEAAVPDVRVLVCYKSGKAGTARAALTGFLSTADWRYEWAEVRASQHVPRLLLDRRPWTQTEKQEEWLKDGRKRLDRIRRLMDATPDELDKLKQEDPDLADALKQSIGRPVFALATRLPQEIMDRAFRGERARIPVSSLSPEFQQMARDLAGPEGATITTDPQGNSWKSFDTADIKTKGVLMIEALPPSRLLNKPSLFVGVYTSEKDQDRAGFDVFDVPGFPEDEPLRAAAAKKREAEANEKLVKACSVRAVTIPWDAPRQDDEPPLAAYLRSFAKQTGLTLLGRWPERDRRFDSLLKKSVLRMPPAEALNILAAKYRCRWEYEEGVLRFWADDPKDRPAVRAYHPDAPPFRDPVFVTPSGAGAGN